MITMALKYTSNWKWSYKSEQSLMNAKTIINAENKEINECSE